MAPILSLEINNESAVSSLTRGLVGDTSFAVLPEITSRMTFVITLIAQLVQMHPFKTDSSCQCARCCGDRPTVYSLQVWLLVHSEVFYLVITSTRKQFFSFSFLSRKAVLSVANSSLLTIRRKHYIHSLRIITVSSCVGLLPLLFTPQGIYYHDASDLQKIFSKSPTLRSSS